MRKTEAEQLLIDYDTDPVAALTAALRIILDVPGGDWITLIAAAPIDAARRRLLFDFDETSLDALASELNERRAFDPPSPA